MQLCKCERAEDGGQIVQVFVGPHACASHIFPFDCFGTVSFVLDVNM